MLFSFSSFYDIKCVYLYVGICVHMCVCAHACATNVWKAEDSLGCQALPYTRSLTIVYNVVAGPWASKVSPVLPPIL